MAKVDRFRFKRLDNIGAADAEDDRQFLGECFVSTGDLNVLKSCSNSRRIVVGRTGTGKSALLIKLQQEEERTIQVRPESLALSYISNSTILNFFADLGVKLDIFFKLLWRHVFTVEILKHHFKIDDEDGKTKFLERIATLFRDKKHENAVDYLKKWGQSFWLETEYRIKELTTTLENDLKATTKAGNLGIEVSGEASSKLTEEQKREVISRAQKVVNAVQIRQLSEIIDLLDDVLSDSQKRYFIVIDRLDENWIEDRLRFRLIRALIETVKDFGRVKNAKIVIAIRRDLLDRVFRVTRDAGFQEEKYESLYLPLEWTRQHLIEVLERRINFLIQQRFTKEQVSYKDILPSHVGKKSGIDYMLERTLMRPRDLILFFNTCIDKAADRPQITVQILRDAEGQYSRDRLRSLADEWVADYPNLIEFAFLLRKSLRQFQLKNLDDVQCGEFCLNFLTKSPEQMDSLGMAAKQFIDCEIEAAEFRQSVFHVFYRVGLVGMKTQVSDAPNWSISGRMSLTRNDITDHSAATVHPAFYRVLGICE